MFVKAQSLFRKDETQWESTDCKWRPEIEYYNSEYIIDWYWKGTGIKLLIAVKIWLNTNEMKGLRMNIYSGFINLTIISYLSRIACSR